MSAPDQKDIIWEARPSHWIKAGTYVACLCLAVVSIYTALSLPALLQGSGAPGEVTRYGQYALLTIAGSSALMIGWTWLNLRYTRYTLTQTTLYTRQNWLLGTMDTLWVHVIRDVRAELPLHLRLIGLGRVVIESLDRSHPRLVVNGIRHPLTLKMMLNEMARQQAQEHGMRAIDTGA